MKTSIVYLIIGLLVINSLNAQVKIGDNPQNLDPASILELQSSNRVLVITRVTDAQMSGISPLPGAVVYNTDQGCLHYYNGTEWINICEELDNSFTVSTRADSLQQVNPQARDNTITILESINPDGSTNYNFEVNRITGVNIVDTSINASIELQDRSITNNKLADKSVGLRNLADATSTGDLLMYNGTAWNFVNRTDLLNTQLDSIVGNEVVGPTDATLLLNGTGSQADPLTLDVAEGGITAFEIATDAVTTDEILDGTILTGDISDDAVTRDKVNSNVAGIGLNQAADGSLEVDNANIAPDWTTITGIPTGFADNTDNDTQLTDAQVAAAVNSEFPNLDTDATDDFSGDFTDLTNIPPNLDTDSTDDFDSEWSSLLNIPAGFADNTDNDTTYSAGTGINIDGSNTISTVNLAGDVIGPITATQIAPGVITNADIAGGAAIDGSKINPVFTSDVTTTGNFVSNGTILNVPDYVFQKYFTGESKLDKTYSFRTLSEIESYVKTYNHLPGIKSENEIRATGKYNLTESSLKHLEKIEELFLHTIEQEKKIKQLQSENQNLTKELDSLKEDLAKIKALLMESPNK